MKHKLLKRILSTVLAMVMLVGLLPTAAIPASAADLVGRNTISSVAITVDRPIAGEPLAVCVPKTTLCNIECIWSVQGLKGVTEIPATTIAEEGELYYLAMVLTPTLDIYTFAASVTGTVNGNSVTVERMSSTKIACMARLTPMTRETEVEVSLPQPAEGATPGTPTITGGHTVSDCTWWKSTTDATSPETQLEENEVFSYSYDYYMEATVTAASSSLFDENTAVSVNGKTAEILEQDTNTIRFRYHVDSSEIASVAGQVYVADGNGGYWSLALGDTKTNGGYTASYQDGVLTLTNTGESTISGSYKKSTLYYGVYANSDLTVRFEGDFCFDLGSVPEDAAHVYGIYVDGDLTLINQADADCTVSFSPAEGALATTYSSGIYCGANLSVQNEGGGDFVLNADAVGVRPVDGAVIANFTNNGIYAAGSIAIGNGCTVNTTAADVALSAEGTTTSRGIYAYYGLTIGKNAVVTATGGNINSSQNAETLNMGFSQLSYGVEVRGGDITVNGGTLAANGGDIDYGDLTGNGIGTNGEQNSYGIYAGNITLNGGAITAKAGYSRATAFVEGSLSEGVLCGDLTVKSGTLTATADDAWKESTGLRVQGTLTQTGGTIIGTGGVAICTENAGVGSRGVYVTGTLTASGGSLTGTGGTMGHPLPSVGLWAKTIALSGTAQVNGTGGNNAREVDSPVMQIKTGYPGDTIGVWTFNDLTVDGSAKLIATGGTVTGDSSSAAEAMSIGLKFVVAEGITISGSGTVVATGGETHYGSKGHSYCDRSCGIYGDITSLTIDGTTVTATGGSVSTKTVSGSGFTMGGVSYGLHLPTGSLTLQNGAKLTATGGVNPTYSTLSTQPSKHNDSYGAYIKGDVTVTDSVFTATGALSMRTVGLLHGGAVTLNGMSSRLTASADDYHTAAEGTKYSYGAVNGDANDETWPGGNYTVNGGILLLQGQTGAMDYVTRDNTLTAPTILRSSNRDGSGAVSQQSPAKFYELAAGASKYVKADSSSVIVTIKDWTYGDAASTPTYTTYDGDPAILWTGTTRAGASYSSDTAPTEAGSYTVTVTYPGGQTGSADFAVKPRPITTCGWNFKGEQLTYNGEEQTQSVTIKYGGKELVEGTDYTLSDNKQTNAGNYTLTITGTGNFGGTNTGNFTVYQKKPTVDDFNIPEIVEYAYTGNPVELPLPTLKETYTGGGTVTLSYSTGATQPTEVGEYTVYFAMTEGDNFLEGVNLEYGTLVIKPAGFAVIVSIEDWTYGDTPKTPTYTDYEGEPTILWTGTTRAGASYSSDTAPTEAGSYTATVTYPGGQTGSASFTVHPQTLNNCVYSLDDSVLTYNGTEQTKGVTVTYKGTELVENVDYTVTGNKQTNAGTYTITITGIGNVEGTKTASFTIKSKTPTAEDFNIPAIGEYAYTDEPVELPLPTLKEPMTGIGEITLNYYRNSGGTLIPAEPRDINEYTVTFNVLPGDNFDAGYDFEYGTLVIKPAGFAVIIDIDDWTYGEEANTPTYTDYEGEPTILWTGTTRAGVDYDSNTAPTEAGDYTVTVTYPGGQTGSANFTVKPWSLSDCSVYLDNAALTYNGLEQTKSVTVRYDGTDLVEGTHYTVTGNTQTNAGSHTITITGIGNVAGTETESFYIAPKTPAAEDFIIPAIGQYAYTGEPVKLPLPTLKEPYTGGGEITLHYNGSETPPTEMGEYEVYFDMAGGINFYSSNWFEYGKLVIKPEGFSVIVEIDDWTYGDVANTPTYTDYDGEPTIRWTGTTRAGVPYSSDTAPTEAGDYTVTVTYSPGGQTGSADFTVHPESVIPYCTVELDDSALKYNGTEQTKGVTVTYEGTVLVEGRDYAVTGNKQTNAGTHTMTITGIGNVGGTRTANFTISKKVPTVEDFIIPEIEEYAYTGNPVALPLPKLKEPYTDCGTITLHYSIDETQSTEIGEHTVYFKIAGGDNFSSISWLEYGKLVIKPAGFSVIVDIAGWTYGDRPSTLTYTDYDGEPTIRWTGTTRAGASYDSNTAPTEAGSYTVTVTYPGGQTGSTDFTVHPRSITACPVNLDTTTLTYNGLEQTKGVTVSYNGITQVEGVDYTVTGNKQTNAGIHTITVTGTGNIEGTRNVTFYINKKTPTVEDFNIPEIGEYAYTGNPVELTPPTLKEPYTGGGTITLYYGSGVITPPTAVGTYTMSFGMSEGQNFTRFDTYGFGALVIKLAADISTVVLRNLDAPQVGKTPDTEAESAYPGLYAVTDVRWLDEEDTEVNSFEEGKFYTAEITVSANYTDGSQINRFNFAESVSASIDGNAVTGDGSSVTVNDDDTVTIRYKFSEPAASAGVTVSGTVTSFNSDTDDITIELYAEGSTTAAYTATVKGNTATYAIEGVVAGNYTMKVSKKNHVTREYTVVVGGDAVVQDVKIHLKGDITGDGQINIMDVNRANLHFKKKITLIGYEFDCANVTGDAQVNIMDVNRMNLHFKGKSKLW